MTTVEQEAITLEDEDPLKLAGEEASPPDDAGAEPAEQDLEPPGDELPELPGADAERITGPWRTARSLLALRNELNHRWPHRDTRTDGFIGDDKHCPGTSDHCPNAAGVVRAFDIDSDGIPAAWLAQYLRGRGKSGDARLVNGGYVIFNKRIASEKQNWTWRAYKGHPHKDHIHLSMTNTPSAYDSTASWGVANAPVTPTPPREDQEPLPRHKLGSRTLKYHEDNLMVGTDVAFVQRWVGIDDDGRFGLRTKAQVERYQGIAGLPQTGVVGPETWRTMRVNV